VEALEHVEHRAVLVVEQAARDVDAEVRIDSDEVLVETSGTSSRYALRSQRLKWFSGSSPW
jgi:hypothetical protein